MFEIVFDSLRDDFTAEAFQECYRRNTTRLQEVARSTNFRFTKNQHVDIKRILENEDCHDLHDLTESLTYAFLQSYGHIRFLIAVPQHSLAARLCEQNNPAAKWGGVLGCHGFLYGNVDDQLILHETLHIFGASDCYEFGDDGLSDLTCGHKNCIMQYNPCKVTLQSPQWLCEPNVRNICTRLEGCS